MEGGAWRSKKVDPCIQSWFVPHSGFSVVLVGAILQEHWTECYLGCHDCGGCVGIHSRQVILLNDKFLWSKLTTFITWYFLMYNKRPLLHEMFWMTLTSLSGSRGNFVQRTQQRIGNTVSRIIGIYCWVCCRCIWQSLSSYHHRSCSFCYRWIDLLYNFMRNQDLKLMLLIKRGCLLMILPVLTFWLIHFILGFSQWREQNDH